MNAPVNIDALGAPVGALLLGFGPDFSPALADKRKNVTKNIGAAVKAENNRVRCMSESSVLEIFLRVKGAEVEFD